jgi:hypothetical protein
MLEGSSTVALCGMLRNERPYLLEWLAYHKLVGFEEIVLYDNGSRDGGGQVLAALAARGELTHVDWPDRPGMTPQITAYLDASRRIGSEWLAYLDLDEFLVLHQDASIGGFLKRFPAEVSAVAINWRIYGSSQQTHYRPGLVIERFTRCSQLDEPKNRHVKSVNRRARIVSALPHSCVLSEGFLVNELGERIALIDSGLSRSASHTLAQVNHYVVKSQEECRLKLRRGRSDIPTGAPDKFRKEGAQFFAEHDLNDCEGSFSQETLDRVKKEVARLESLLPPKLRKPPPLPGRWSPRLLWRW